MLGFPSGSVVKNLPAMQEMQEVPSLGWEDLLEEGMANHSSILAWESPWTEEPGGLQFMGLQSQTDASSLLGSDRSPGEGNGNSLQYSCLGNPMDRGSWQIAVLRVTRV